jgi:hypothetical protein
MPKYVAPNLRRPKLVWVPSKSRWICAGTMALEAWFNGILIVHHILCNTPGVDHQLGSGFKLKHDSLSGDDNVKVNLWRWAWPKVGCCIIALHIGPFSKIYAWMVLWQYLHVSHLSTYLYWSLKKFHGVWNQKVTWNDKFHSYWNLHH